MPNSFSTAQTTGESVDVDVGGGACTEWWLQLQLPHYWQSGLQIVLEGNLQHNTNHKTTLINIISVVIIEHEEVETDTTAVGGMMLKGKIKVE